MTLFEIYRIALAEGLTAKQAAERFGVKASSVSKMKTRHKMPSLKTEFDIKSEAFLNQMPDTQLQSYMKALVLPKNSKRCLREIKMCESIIESRNAYVS
jgi:transcriptional regulator with XRE-family HTH domain